jgi:DNA-binding response OmpR family regulator
MKPPVKILTVDDEEDICEIIKFNLENEGFEVDSAFSGEEALSKDLHQYSLFILDIMMGGISGYKLADEIRKNRQIETPIIFLSAKNAENNILTGFSLGADDYVTKPFSIKELKARIEAVLRRGSLNKISADKRLSIEGFELDDLSKKIKIDGIKVEVTPHEFLILKLLMQNAGKVFAREKILAYAWDKNTFVVERTVDVHITRLRKKMGAYGKHLVSRTGYGYCFDTEA